MKTTVELWVRLKVIDLVAQTAEMTLTDKLDFSDVLRGIMHYSYWSMEAEGAGVRPMLDEIDRAVRLDSAFTNQNKHRYRLSSAGGAIGDLSLEKDYPLGGAPPPNGGVFAFDCLVREKRRDREIGYEQRLNARVRGVTVTEMRCGEVWRLILSASSKEAGLAAVEGMVVSRSRREGLLLNPHYQRYEIIGSARFEADGAWKPLSIREGPS